MRLLFDIVTSEGEEFKQCYFLKYMKNIRGGKNNIVLSHAIDSVRCFNKNDQEILNLNLIDVDINKIIDEETGTDITESVGFLTLKTICRDEVFID